MKLLMIFISIFILYFVFVSFSRHNNYYSLRLDLGNMDQTVWNVSRGNGFILTDPFGDKNISRLGIHADFLLILLAPFYFIWSDPRVLLLVQTIVVSLGAIPIYWISKEKLHSSRLALLFACLYLLYPPLQRVLLYDFHAEALSTTFLLFAFWFMITKKYSIFVFFAFLAALGKEQIWLIVAMMGVYIIFKQKNKVLGTLIAGISGFIFYLLLWRIIPSFAVAKQHFALVYLSEFGENQTVIVKNVLSHPLEVLKVFLEWDRLVYYFQLFSPVAFLSIFSPVALLFALPSFMINILSNNALLRQIDYQYTSTITPFIFITSIQGMRIILKKFPQYTKQILSTVVILCLISSYEYGELPFEQNSKFTLYTTTQKEASHIKSVIDSIGQEDSVSVTNNIGAHLTQRVIVYNFPINADKADYILAKLDDPNAWPNLEEQQQTIELLKYNPHYTLIEEYGSFVAFRRTVD